jgi:hypothetical protein
LNFIFSNKGLVKIGFYSFSIYLFHYPLIGILRLNGYLQESSSISDFVIIFFILVLLSSIFYNLVEKNLKNNKKNIYTLQNHLISFIFIMTFLTFSINSDFNKTYYQAKLEKLNVPKNYKFDNSFYHKQWHKSVTEFSHSDFRNQEKKILVLGDSLAVDLYGILKSDDKFNLDYSMRLSYDENVFLNILNLENFENQKYINSVDIILIRFNYNRKDLNFKILEEFLQKYHNKKKIVLVYQNYNHLMLFKNLSLLDYDLLTNTKFKLNKIEKKYFEQRVEKLNQPLLNLINKFEKVYFFNIGDIFCNNIVKSCKVLDNNGYKLFWDQHHLTAYGYFFFSEETSSSIKKIITK